jgi:hypothetical protein
MERKKCPNRELNEKECPCEYTNCERHGLCCECIKFHRERGEKPACLH